MLETSTVTEFDAGLPATLAFRIRGRVREIELELLSDRLEEAARMHDRVDLMLVVDRIEGPGLAVAPLKAGASALRNLRACVVAAAPETVAETVQTLGRLLPVKVESFDTEAEARAHLAALPRLA